jgi:hypothetical protein
MLPMCISKLNYVVFHDSGKHWHGKFVVILCEPFSEDFDTAVVCIDVQIPTCQWYQQRISRAWLQQLFFV